eukprot:1529040-Pyramimonas_sp.AAC.1
MSRSWVLHHIPLPCIKILLLPAGSFATLGGSPQRRAGPLERRVRRACRRCRAMMKMIRTTLAGLPAGR